MLLRKHRQHAVVTHRDTLVAVDGALGSHPDAEEAALAFLAARVAAARASGGEPDPGVVRRYALTHHLVRDLGTDVKLHLDAVQEGRIDPFVLPRIMGPRWRGLTRPAPAALAAPHPAQHASAVRFGYSWPRKGATCRLPSIATATFGWAGRP